MDIKSIEKHILTEETNSYNYLTFSQDVVYMMLALSYLQSVYSNKFIVSQEIIIYKVKKNLQLKSFMEYNLYFGFPIENFKKSKKKYMAIYLILDFDIPSNIMHANILLFEKKSIQGMNKIFCERFEPGYINECFKPDPLQKQIDKRLEEIFEAYQISYIPPSDIMVLYGPQECSKDVFGYCQTYVIRYLDMILANNPNISRSTIVALFNSETIDKLAHIKKMNNYIRNIVLYICNLDYISFDTKLNVLRYDIVSKNEKQELTKYLFSMYQFFNF